MFLIQIRDPTAFIRLYYYHYRSASNSRASTTDHCIPAIVVTSYYKKWICMEYRKWTYTCGKRKDCRTSQHRTYSLAVKTHIFNHSCPMESRYMINKANIWRIRDLGQYDESTSGMDTLTAMTANRKLFLSLLYIFLICALGFLIPWVKWKMRHNLVDECSHYATRYPTHEVHWTWCADRVVSEPSADTRYLACMQLTRSLSNSSVTT